MKIPKIPLLALLILAGILAAGTGFLTAVATGVGSQAPTKTTTVNVGTGETGSQGPPGPAGPPGPKGDPGAESCPAGYTFGAVLFNAPGGQTQIATCIKD